MKSQAALVARNCYLSELVRMIHDCKRIKTLFLRQ